MSARTLAIVSATALFVATAFVQLRGGPRTLGRATTVRTVRPGAR